MTIYRLELLFPEDMPEEIRESIEKMVKAPPEPAPSSKEIWLHEVKLCYIPIIEVSAIRGKCSKRKILEYLSCCSLTGTSYTCKPKGTCANNTDCAPDWCCTADPALGADKESPGSCSYNSTNPIYKSKYLCDPPGWNSEEASERKSLLELILNFFFNPFS